MKKLWNPANRQLFLVVAIIVGALVLSRALVATRTLPKTALQEVRMPVTVTQLRRGAYPVRVVTTGRVAPRSTVAITPQVSGRVQWISDQMYSGGYLDEDDVLFRIEAVDYENEVARESAAVAKARTDLALEHAEAEASLDEWRALNEGQDAPPLVSREPQIAQAEAELAAARARLAQAELNLSRTRYRLPFSGRVMSSSLEVGQFVVSGQPYGEIYNRESLEISLSLAPSDIRWFLDPEQAEVLLRFEDAASGQGPQIVSGRIIRLGALLDEATRYQQIVVKPLDDSPLIPGMLTEVVLASAPVAGTWKIPIPALQGQYIWIVDDAGQLERLQPEVIATLSDSVIARLPARTTSLRVVDTPVNGAVEGARVEVVDLTDTNAPASAQTAIAP
ncbi:MAG TPA: hypothetical protein DCZ13_05465 [Porticoccaceae bacterium]|nr:hypothetical protein [Porticoccaceae bacterium]